MMMALLVIGALVFFSTDRRFKSLAFISRRADRRGLIAAETRSMWLGAAVGGVYLIWCWKKWVLIAIPVLTGIVLLVNPFELGDRVRSAIQPKGRAGFERSSGHVPGHRISDDQGASAARNRTGAGAVSVSRLSAAGVSNCRCQGGFTAICITFMCIMRRSWESRQCSR